MTKLCEVDSSLAVTPRQRAMNSCVARVVASMAASLAAGVVLAVSPMRRIIAGGGWRAQETPDLIAFNDHFTLGWGSF
jgi:hypothetical protein